MTTVTQALKEAKQKQIKETAEIIFKYQKFKNNIILEKLGNNLAESSKRNYITCARYYIKTGLTYKNVVGSSFYKYLQECTDKCMQPLIPSFEDRLREVKRNYTKKEAKPPITKIIPKQITSDIEYAIRLNNNIILQNSEQEARGFLNGIKYLEPNITAKIITVEIQEVK